MVWGHFPKVCAPQLGMWGREGSLGEWCQTIWKSAIRMQNSRSFSQLQFWLVYLWHFLLFKARPKPVLLSCSSFIKPWTESCTLIFNHLHSTMKRWINKIRNEDKSLRSMKWRKNTKERNIWTSWMKRLARKKSWNLRHWDRNIWMHQRIFIIQ